jgi:hypothetical protein
LQHIILHLADYTDTVLMMHHLLIWQAGVPCAHSAAGACQPPPRHAGRNTSQQS